MPEPVVDLLVGLGVSLLALYALLLVALVVARPRGVDLAGALRLVPDVVRLVARLARDPAVPRGARVGLWLLLAYLALPVDLVPDVLPVVGQVDDVVVALLALRAVTRRVGTAAVAARWPGTPEGLAAVLRLAGLPAPRAPEEPPHHTR